MKLHELKVKAVKPAKRVGRGIGSGYGKTAGRGTKGQRARSGAKLGPTFEGGQNALVHRLPKLHGFRSKRPAVQLIFTDQLNQFAGSAKVGLAELKQAGLIRYTDRSVKLLQRGPLNQKLVVEIPAASQTATETVTKKGGRIVTPEPTTRPKAE